MSDPRWVLRYEGYNPAEESKREALCALGNGVFALRGAHALGLPESYPGCYAAGVYNRLISRVAGREVENEDLVNLPNPLALSFRLPGQKWLSGDSLQINSYVQELDLQKGLLSWQIELSDEQGRITRLTSTRLVHMSYPHLAAESFTLTPLNWAGEIEIKSFIDGRVENRGVARYRDLASRHLEILEAGEAAGSVYLTTRTNNSHIQIANAIRTQVAGCEPEFFYQEGQVGQIFKLSVAKGQDLKIEKFMSLYTSRDPAIANPTLAATAEPLRAGSFAELFKTQIWAWQELWSRADVRLASDLRPEANHIREQLILRLHIYHLLSSYSPNSVQLDVGIPARGLTGEAYRGHVFWDELFVLPFYNLHFPEVSRAALMYRYRRLLAARVAAKNAGKKGAMFPWQSGSDGREESQTVHFNPVSGNWDPDYSSLQRHIGAAIAYNVWRYYQATGDLDFLEQFGAELILEIARFFASLASYNPERERYEIKSVMGPDEYHERYPGADSGGLNNNSYTNFMAVWCCEQALEALQVISPRRREEICRQVGFSSQEAELFRDLSRKMLICFHEGVISQFEGYEKLLPLDFGRYRERYGQIDRMDRILKAEGDSPDHYQVSKQADLTMLFYLFKPRELARVFHKLGYSFGSDTIEKNVRYYSERTSHGSTLSRVVYAAAYYSIDQNSGLELFREALASDIDDIQGGTTGEGVHLGAMAGTLSTFIQHFAGIDTGQYAVALAPRLPVGLVGFHVSLRYQGDWVTIDMAPERVKIEVMGSAAMPILVYGELYQIRAGEWREFDSGT